MKMAAALCLAKVAKLDVPPEVERAYGGKKFTFGREYIIPTPFDPRLINEVPVAVAKAAMESGVATKNIEDWTEYKYYLQSRIAKTHW